MGENQKHPKRVTATRYYDGSIKFEYEPAVENKPLVPQPVLDALTAFASGARRLPAAPPDQEGSTSEQRTALATWATDWKSKLKDIDDLRGEDGVDILSNLHHESEDKSNPQTANMVENLQNSIDPILEAAQRDSPLKQINDIIKENLPILIYFENYGILDSAIWLPRFLEDLERDATHPPVRTVNAMFRHVGLDPFIIKQLGNEEARAIQQQGNQPTQEQIADDQKNKENRAIQLNAASVDISKRFSDWWSQRRHKIRYQADGDYFRIWIADDRRTDVEIELESRSKGFQWFFSFYLVFLAESDLEHKHAILLLDEPGLHLHATAQQELIAFFEKLSETNQLVYTTHSPFLIDGENLHRVRPVTENETGHSRISTGIWPSDRETIFPLQAAAGYAMIRGLFQNRKNVLVEGMSDFYYLHALSQQCAQSGRSALPDDIYITPCGGTKHVGHLASLFLGNNVRPLVLLDGDDAGRARRNALIKELYAGHDTGILMLDEVLSQTGQEIEIEDILGEKLFLAGLKTVLGKTLQLNQTDRSAGSLPSQVKAAANRRNFTLPMGWKASVALHLVASWAKNGTTFDDEIIDKAAALFSAIIEAFHNIEN